MRPVFLHGPFMGLSTVAPWLRLKPDGGDGRQSRTADRLPPPCQGSGERAARDVRAADFKVMKLGDRSSDHRRMLGVVGALALTTVIGGAPP